MGFDNVKRSVLDAVRNATAALLDEVCFFSAGLRRNDKPGDIWESWEPTGRLYWTRLSIPVTRRFAERVDAFRRLGRKVCA